MRIPLSAWPERFLGPLIAGILCSLFFAMGSYSRLSEGTMDLFFQLRGIQETSQQVVIIGVDERSLTQLGQWPFPRAYHAQLLQKLHLAKSIGFDILFHGEKLDDAQFRKSLKTHNRVTLAVAESYENSTLTPAASLGEKNSQGYIETIADNGGIVRKVELCRGASPSFASAMTGFDCAGISVESSRWINFYGPAFTFLSLSYVDVLKGRVSEEFFRDRYVLIGARALALGDVHRSPLTGRFPLPGVEVQATIVDNMISGRFLQVSGWGGILLCIPVALLGVLLWPAGREVRNILLSILAIGFVWWGCWEMFSHGYFLDPVPATVFLLLAYPLHLITQWLGTTVRLVREITLLDRNLGESLASSFSSLPTPLKEVDDVWNKRGVRGGLRRHLFNLHLGIDLLSLQNKIINQLLSQETPPLVLWERESGKVILVNQKFKELWPELNSEKKSIPELPEFLAFLGSQEVIDERGLAGGTGDRSKPGDEIRDIEYLRHGRKRYLRVILHKVSGLSLGSPGVLASCTDITEIKELERMRAEVMNVVSHELKLPLTTILGYAEMLSDSTEGGQRGYAEKILIQTNRLTQMIEGFLSITRIESGRYKINAFPFSPLDTIQDCISGIKHGCDKKNIMVDVLLPAKATPIHGDESLIVQALLNVLDNAVKYSPHGGHITVELREKEAVHAVKVSDEGPGVPEDERQMMLEKFVRGSEVEGETKGFGLGLSFVRQVIEGHGGNITIGSAVGGGCLVELTLPKAGAEPEAPERKGEDF